MFSKHQMFNRLWKKNCLLCLNRNKAEMSSKIKDQILRLNCNQKQVCMHHQPTNWITIKFKLEMKENNLYKPKRFNQNNRRIRKCKLLRGKNLISIIPTTKRWFLEPKRLKREIHQFATKDYHHFWKCKKEGFSHQNTLITKIQLKISLMLTQTLTKLMSWRKKSSNNMHT